MLEPRFPLELKVIPRVVDDLVEGRGFGVPSPKVLELPPGFLPRVAPEHTGLFGEVRLVGVLELVRSADRVQIRLQGEPYVRVWVLDLLGDVRLPLG